MCMCWYTIGWTSPVDWASAVRGRLMLGGCVRLGGVCCWVDVAYVFLFHVFPGQRSLHGNLYLGKKDTGSVLQESEFQVTEESKVRLAHCFKPHPTTPYHIPPLHTTPYRSTSLHTTPHHSTPLHTSPHLSTPLHTTPHHSTPLHTTPHHSTPLHTTPHHSTPLHTTRYHSTPLHTTPYHSTPLHTTLHHSTPHLSTLHIRSSHKLNLPRFTHWNICHCSYSFWRH